MILAMVIVPAGDWMANSLENQYHPVEELPALVNGIIVLGGSTEPMLAQAHGQAALNASAERLLYFSALARQYPSAKLVFSGGRGSPFSSGPTEADTAKTVLALSGMDVQRVFFEDKARNTYENATNSLRLIKPKADEVWILITSAMHMPRAVGTFQNVGWSVLPFPVDYSTAGRTPLLGSFSVVDRLAAFSRASREWAALFTYRLLGRTTDLIPKQDRRKSDTRSN